MPHQTPEEILAQEAAASVLKEYSIDTTPATPGESMLSILGRAAANPSNQGSFDFDTALQELVEVAIDIHRSRQPIDAGIYKDDAEKNRHPE